MLKRDKTAKSIIIVRKLIYFLIPLMLWSCGDPVEEVAPQKTFNVAVTEAVFTPVVGAKPVMITAEEDWTSEITPASASSWLSITPAKGSAGSTVTQVRVTAIGNGDTRTATIKVSAGGQTRSIAVSQEKAKLILDPAQTLNIGMGEEVRKIAVQTNATTWTYICDGGDGWCTISKNSDTNELSVTTTMNTGNQRTANLTVSGGGLTAPMTIIQAAYNETDFLSNYYQDGNYLKIQGATAVAENKGVVLVMMGDGYTKASMKKTTGKYEADMREATDHFFSTYPISEFRDYFTVYMVVAVSKEAGMSRAVRSGNTTTITKAVNNALSTVWTTGSTEINCNTNTVCDYARAVTPLGLGTITDNDILHGLPITVVMPINEDVYAGTCIFWNVDTGMSIGMVAKNSISSGGEVDRSFKATLVHECCGHGFAKLADEYVNSSTAIPATNNAQNDYPHNKANLQTWKNYGCLENVDLHSDISQTTWAGFANNRTKYPASVVGTHEGGYYYAKEVWRPEDNTCMNNNVPYFNAPSRYAQVRRIMKISGKNTSYTLTDFMAWDTPPDYKTVVKSSGARAPELPFVPLGPPIMREYNGPRN